MIQSRMLLIDEYSLRLAKDPKRGRLLIANHDIEPGTLIGDYMGDFFPHDQEQVLEKNHGLYAMEYDDTYIIFPNETERNSKDVPLINHSCEENCGIISYREHALYYALRRIFKDEELTVNYSISPDEDASLSKYQCHCGSNFCRGTFCVSFNDAEINASFENKLPGDERPVARPVLHAHEEPLDKYPENIPDYKEFDIYGSTNVNPLILDDEALLPLSELRKKIRETGKRLFFKKLHQTICGIRKNVILSEYHR